MSPAPWSRAVGIAVAATLAGAAVTVPPPLTATAQLTDSRSIGGNTVTTAAACATGPAYAAGVLAASPSFYWRIGERTPPAVTSVADATSAGLAGTVRGSGLTFGTATAGLIQCDDTYAVRFPGTAPNTRFLVQTMAVPNPDRFTVSAWVSTTTTRGGWVVGMGSSATGASPDRDRVVYLQANGRPGFSVGIGPRVSIQGPTAVNDGLPHLLVGTLGPTGMALYVDGVQVATNPSTTSGAVYAGNLPATADGFGYWRVGYDATAGLGPSVPTRNQLTGVVDEVAVWQDRALSAAEVSELYAQNHW
jgi:Concanavalin A-like lectin/glucanases superfamily